MAVFAWQGIDARGKRVKGVRDADNAKSLRVLLRREGIMATAIEGEAMARQRSAREIDFRRMFRRVSGLQLALITRQLATLLKAGVPLVEAMTAIIEQTDQPEIKSAFTQTRDRVNEGISLADALKAHPAIFPHLYVNMVAAGEASGTLDTVLARLADFLEAQQKLRNKVTSALAYPAFMGVTGIGVIMIMMVVVVPKVTAIFDDFQQSLPWYTRALISISHMMTNYWWLIFGSLGLIIWWFRRWKGTPKGKASWDAKVLVLPIFGQLFLMVAVTRFARTLSTLLASGVPVLTAMEITRNVLGNESLMQVIEEARASIREGESIAVPLKRSGKFPPIVTHMIAIGERSGQLESMLEHVASAYDNQVETRVAAMTSMLEPLMIVVMGVGAGSIAFAILMPLLKINEFVQ